MQEPYKLEDLKIGRYSKRVARTYVQKQLLPLFFRNLKNNNNKNAEKIYNDIIDIKIHTIYSAKIRSLGYVWPLPSTILDIELDLLRLSMEDDKRQNLSEHILLDVIPEVEYRYDHKQLATEAYNNLKPFFSSNETELNAKYFECYVMIMFYSQFNQVDLSLFHTTRITNDKNIIQSQVKSAIADCNKINEFERKKLYEAFDSTKEEREKWIYEEAERTVKERYNNEQKLLLIKDRTTLMNDFRFQKFQNDTITNEEVNLQLEECQICMTPDLAGYTMTSCKNNHAFHTLCLLASRLSSDARNIESQPNFCPFCRRVDGDLILLNTKCLKCGKGTGKCSF